jgi:hypothetical protein
MAFAEDGTAVAAAQQTRGRRRGDKMDKAETASSDPSPEPNGMLSALRKAASTVTGSSMLTKRPKNDVNRKGTIVLEHLLQAADIAHTMQVRPAHP